MTRRHSRPHRGDATVLQDPRPVDDATGGRLRLRNWPLRTKLLAVLLIPTLTALALMGLHVKQDLDQADRLAELAAHGRVDDALAEVVHQLQRERDLTVRFVAGGRKAEPSELRNQRDRVDTAIGTLNRQLDGNEPRLSASGAAGLRQTQARFGVLTGIRYAGEHSTFPADAVLRSYSELISGVLDISDQAVTGITDPELARLRLAANALARVKDQMSIKRALLAEALEQNRLTGDGLRALLGAEAALTAARNDFRKFASPQQQRMYDDTVIGLIVDVGNETLESALTRAEMNRDLTGLEPDKWDMAATYTVNLAHKVQTAMQVQTQQHTDVLAEQARASAISNVGVVLGVLLFGAILAVIITRSLLRPLRVLRQSALEVAEHRLPAAVEDILADPRPQPEGVQRWLGVAPVPVFSREELGQVARAFDAVHGEAVRLAGEQGLLRENVNAMFVNLSRRSQDLIERQLSVLDRMEADEQDADTLGGLFELDHLATRMRRNSENLLVLAGTDLGRTAPGPVAANEIVGAALSEVEHYQRVELAATPELVVHGDAGSDLVHVISELLENATLYSAPETMVTVDSTVSPHGSWQVHITDRGAGMPEAEIERANRRLVEPPEVNVEVSRRMGLYVVARLARRHQIDVRLRAAEGGGLTATVVVPAELVAHAPTPKRIIPIEVVTPARPPSPEFAKPSPPMPDELPSLPVVAESLPPRRAPIEHEPPPAWPTDEHNPHHLDLDAPTDRMPAYQEVLSQWFAPTREQRTRDDSAGSSATDGARPPQPDWRVPAPATDGHENNGLCEDLDLAAQVPKTEFSPGTVEFPDQSRVILSRDPDAVRGRMASLQNGFERGRHIRAAAARVSGRRTGQ